MSSLVQLMVDPHYRSISGFESLIQKEWVALGHPFTTRHALTVDVLGKEDHQEVSEWRRCPEPGEGDGGRGGGD